MESSLTLPSAMVDLIDAGLLSPDVSLVWVLVTSSGLHGSSCPTETALAGRATHLRPSAFPVDVCAQCAPGLERALESMSVGFVDDLADAFDHVGRLEATELTGVLAAVELFGSSGWAKMEPIAVFAPPALAARARAQSDRLVGAARALLRTPAARLELTGLLRAALSDPPSPLRPVGRFGPPAGRVVFFTAPPILAEHPLEPLLVALNYAFWGQQVSYLPLDVFKAVEPLLRSKDSVTRTPLDPDAALDALDALYSSSELYSDLGRVADAAVQL